MTYNIMEQFDPKKQIAIIWSIDDIQSIRPDLNDEQAMEVLEYALRKHDATMGINWDVLETLADILFEVKKDNL